MRIVGVDIPNNKRLVIALTYIHGIGPFIAKKVCNETNLSESLRVKDLTDEQQKKIVAALSSYILEGDLRTKVMRDVKRLISIGCYRGVRHRMGLPVRSQNTRNNARNAKKLNGKYKI